MNGNEAPEYISRGLKDADIIWKFTIISGTTDVHKLTQNLANSYISLIINHEVYFIYIENN